jgi:uncharacterized protein YndB with AHSA1/START domain
MTLQTAPVARTQLLIRKPAAEVFGAFIDPAVTSRFWFSSGSAPLVQGTTVTWYWDMYGMSVTVGVKAIEPNCRILIEWPTPVEWLFSERADGTTLVTIVASGFPGTDDERVARALDSMGGFSLVLAACKAFLEHGIELNVVADHDPDAHVKSGA